MRSNQIPYHWTHDIIGSAYELGKSGPDHFDCWGVLVWKFKHVDNIDLPTFEDVIKDSAEQYINKRTRSWHKELHRNWYELQRPEDGCAVFMGKRMRLYSHVAVYVEQDGGFYIHAVENARVLAMSRHTLKLHGWRNFKYYKHKEQK